MFLTSYSISFSSLLDKPIRVAYFSEFLQTTGKAMLKSSSRESSQTRECLLAGSLAFSW